MSYVYFMNTNVELLTRQAARDLAKQYDQPFVPIVRNNADWYHRRTTFFKYDQETAHLTGDFANPPRNFFTPVTRSDDMHCDSMHGIYQRAGTSDGPDLQWAIKGLVQEQRDQLPHEEYFLKRCALAFCNRVLCDICNRHSDKCECDGIGKLAPPEDSAPEITTVVCDGITSSSDPTEPPMQEGNPGGRAHGILLSGVRPVHYVDHGDDNCPGNCEHMLKWSYDKDVRTCVPAYPDYDDLGQEDQQATAQDPPQITTSRKRERPTEAAMLVADQRRFKDWEGIPVYDLQMEDKFSYIENYLIK